MKRVVSVSLGSSSRDHAVTTTFLGQEISIQRIGTNGDVREASRLFRELDGNVDALGVGGISLALHVRDNTYPLYDAHKLVKGVRYTPIVDGSGVKETLERDVMQSIDEEIGHLISPRRALVTSALDRFSLAESFMDAGYEMVFGDFMWALNIPLALRSIRTLERVGALLLPVFGRLPCHMLYPTGNKQQEIVPKWKHYYEWATVIAGDFNYIKRHLPARLDGKIVVTNTTTQADVDLLSQRGASFLITTTPRLGTRSFGTNVLEAALVAAAGKGRPLTNSEIKTLLEEEKVRPTVMQLPVTTAPVSPALERGFFHVSWDHPGR